MGFVEKWNKLAKKSLYINNTFEIGVGRLMYMSILNCFLSVGMLLSGGNLIGVVWLWGDMVGSFKTREEKKNENIK